MFKNSKLFFWTIEILAVILIIFLLNQITFVFTPVSTLLGLLFIPFLISGFLFYVFHPVVHFMERKWHFKKIVAVLLIVLALIAVFVIIIATVIPNVINQLTGLIASTPKMYSQTLSWVEGLSRNSQFSQLYKQVNGDQIINNLNISYTDVLKNVLNGLTFSLGNVVGVIAGIVLVVILVPILLFYMLNDGDKMLPHVRKHILTEDKLGIFGLLENMNKAISKYILGVSIDASIIFVGVFIIYLVWGIPYAFLFALFSAVTNLIPYAGPYIGVTPMLLTVVFNSPVKAIGAMICVFILQQIDGNFIYPKVVGEAIKVHPVTVMILMLVAGSLYGILGMIIAVPLYSLVKEIVKFLAGLYRNHKKQKTLPEPDENMV